MTTASVQSKNDASDSQLTNGVSAAPTHAQISERAYLLWESRGRPIGSSEEDWFKAEADLLSTAGLAITRQAV